MRTGAWGARRGRCLKGCTVGNKAFVLFAVSFLGVFAPSAGRAEPLDKSFEFKVNSNPELSVYQPQVAADADGDFVVVWNGTDFDPGDPTHQASARRYTREGVPIGEDFRLSPTSAFASSPDVAMDAAGNFVIVWSDTVTSGNDNDSYSIQMHRFNADGTPDGGPVQVNTLTAGAQRGPIVAMNSAGQGIVAWAGPDRARRFDATGALQGAEFALGGVGLSSVAVSESGVAIAAWTESLSAHAALFGADGTAIGTTFRLDDPLDPPLAALYDVDVVFDSATTFLAIWSRADQVSGDDVFARMRRFDTSTQPPTALGVEVSIPNSAGADRGAPWQVAVATDGRILVYWAPISDFGAQRTSTVSLRLYDSDLQPVETEFRLPDEPLLAEVFPLYPSIASNGRGGFIAIWGRQDYSLGIGVTTVQARRLLPSQAANPTGIASCKEAKLIAARTFVRGTAKCYANAAKRGLDDVALAACLSAKQAELDAAFAAQDKKVSGCPTDPETMRLAGEDVWVATMLDDAVIGRNELPSKCLKKKMTGIRALSSEAARCEIEGLVSGDTAALAACRKKASDKFGKRWNRADGRYVCSTAAAEDVRDTVLFNTTAAASAANAVCGDSTVSGYEECDDGANTDGDGCNAQCQAEECIELATPPCIRCGDGASPDVTFTTCVCDAGYESVSGACKDVDECTAATSTCPAGTPCVNTVGGYACAIACTQAAFESTLATCGGTAPAITFDCTKTIIPIAPDPAGGPVWTNARKLDCDDMVIDGLDRDITFQLMPACFEGVAAAQCPKGLNSDGTCTCPENDFGTGFLNITGDRNMVRNLTARYFFEGIHTRGGNNTVEDVWMVRGCDDSITNTTSGVGNIFRGMKVEEGCDKCSQNFGDIALTNSLAVGDREYFNAIFEDVAFAGCEKPFRMTTGGRFLLDRVRMSSPSSSRFVCEGPNFTSDAANDLVLYMRDSTVDDCTRGLRFGGDVEASLTHNRIRNSRHFGVRVQRNARVSMTANIVTGNGGRKSSEGVGGILLKHRSAADDPTGADDAMIDLGGGELLIDGITLQSGGTNILCDNRGALKVPANDVSAELNSPTLVVRAQNNWWCGKTPGSRVVGNVDTSTPLTAEPSLR